jgi:uncharacterized protein (DUF4415 family)
MKTQVERSQFDDYELPDEVDFTEAIRGRFYQPKKVSMTIRLDDDIVLFFKEEHLPYQALINHYLRNYVKQVIHTTAAS